MSQWQVYILRCADRTLYTGVTTDLSARLEKHNAGLASRYTRARLPVAVAYSEPAVSRSQAQSREAEIKKLTQAEKLVLIRKAKPPKKKK